MSIQSTPFVSDEIDFVLDQTKGLVITCAFNGIYADVRVRNSAHANITAGSRNYYKGANVNEHATVAPSGYTANADPSVHLWDKIDVYVSVGNATGTLISTANTALTSPTTGDICMLIENNVGTATLGTHLKAFVSRNGGTNWYEATGDYALTDVGTWGSGTKKIITANNIPFAGPAGTDIRYKIEWAGQSAASKVTRIHATSLAWA